MSDTEIVTSMQTIIQATQLDSENAFLSASVVIDDWSYRDTEIINEPFCRIDSPVLLGAVDSIDGITNQWLARATVAKPFEDWNITRPLVRKLRTAVLDIFNSSNYRSLGNPSSTVAYTVTNIRDEFPDVFLYVYDRYMEPEELIEAVPTMIELPILFEIEEVCT